MPSYHEAWLRHQQSRWLQPDGDRWIRPDAARFLAPGADITKAFPVLARKYSPDQPRVPAGNPDGGQWTDGAASGSTSGGHPGRNVSIAAEVGNLGLFEIKPRDNTIGGVRLAGDLPPGTNLGGPSDEPPKIPPERPRTSAQRTAFARAAASWLARHPGLAGEI